MSNLAAALLAFQANVPSLHADATNGHFNNKYLSLEGLMRAILPALNEQGLVLMQFPSSIAGLPALRTKLLHAASGESEEDKMPLVLAKNDPQAQGSGLTYARRYAAMAMLGLVADEDDDGNGATRSVREPQAARPPAPVSQATTASEPASRAEFPIPDGVQAELAENGRVAPDSGLPQDVKVHFGKNAGKTLGELSTKSVEWYAANELRPGASADDRRLRAAAITLLELGVK